MFTKIVAFSVLDVCMLTGYGSKNTQKSFQYQVNRVKGMTTATPELINLSFLEL